MASNKNQHLFGLVPILFAVFLVFAVGMTILATMQQTNSTTNASSDQPMITTTPKGY